MPASTKAVSFTRRGEMLKVAAAGSLSRTAFMARPIPDLPSQCTRAATTTRAVRHTK